MKAAYLPYFMDAVLLKVKRADEMGSKTTWTTSDHLDALASAVDGELQMAVNNNDARLQVMGGHRNIIRDVLGECYNISQFQQKLAEKYKSTGHFQREGRKSVPDEIDEYIKKAQAASKGLSA